MQSLARIASRIPVGADGSDPEGSPRVDPSSRHKNRSDEFKGASYQVSDVLSDREEGILDSVRRFVAEHNRLPDQRTWTAAAMTPSEKTVRNRFGSFRAAATAAGAEPAE